MRSFLPLVLLLLPLSVQAQISLEAYRDSVLMHSTAMEVSAAQSDKALADMKSSRTDFFPNLSAGGSFTTDFRREGDGNLWGFQLQPRIEQTIYAGGGVRAAYRQSISRYASTLLSEQMVWFDVRYQADYAYWLVSAMQLYVAATDQYASIVSSLYRVVEERFREGYVAKGDLLQIETRLSEVEFSQISTRNQYEVALHRFNALRGGIQSSDVLLSNSIIDSIPLPERVEVGELYDRRPDLQMALLAVDVAEQGVRVAQAQFNPRLTAGVSGSWQTYSPNFSGKTYLDGALVVGLSVPIFHWGERRQEVAAARSSVRSADADLVQVLRDVAQQEADGWSALVNSYSQMQSSLYNLEIAGENLSISTYSYNEGQATVLDVLQAQLSWIQIYTNAITARFNYAVAVSEYQRLTLQ